MGPHMETAVQVSIAIFAAGVIYHSGRLSARVDALELWRSEIRADLAKLLEGIHRLEGLIKGEEV